MWILVYLYDEDEDPSPDLIPKEWLINENNCWYPKDFKLSTIKSYAKKKEQPDQKQWTKCKIEVIEKNIDTYDYGLKLVYKVNKNNGQNSNLHSEVEERGRGQRQKQKPRRLESNVNTNLFDNLDNSDSSEDNDAGGSGGKETSVKRKNAYEYPEFPKKVNHQTNENVSMYNTVPSGSNSEPTNNDKLSLNFSSSNISISPLIKQNHVHLDSSSNHHDISFSADTTENLTPTYKCKLSKKIAHSCTYSVQKENMNILEAIGHQLCKLSADVFKIKSNTHFIKNDVSSFIDYNSSNNQPEKPLEDNILSSFPLKNEEELLTIEKKLLSEDLSYTNKLVSAFIFACEGKNISKVTNSMLRIIFSDDLAKGYSWKGQKTKNALKHLRISKVIIDSVSKKFPNLPDCREETKRSIMSWLAQAPTRIARNMQKPRQEME